MDRRKAPFTRYSPPYSYRSPHRRSSPRCPPDRLRPCTRWSADPDIAKDRSPNRGSRSPQYVLVVHRDRDAPFETPLIEHRLEVLKLVPIADDPAARRKGSDPL